MKNSKKVVFAVPGSKVFISRYYKNQPDSFLNISLTGSKCDLLCSHCKGLLLKQMIDFCSGGNINSNVSTGLKSSVPAINTGMVTGNKKTGAAGNNNRDNRLINLIENYGNHRTGGVLLSGGFDKNGILPLDNRIFDEIKHAKEQYANKLKIYMHTGFVSQKIADRLNACGLDGVFVNIISDSDTIRDIYNMPRRSPEDFYNNIKTLINAGLRVSPHIIIGLNRGKITEEFKAVEELAGTGIDSLVFAIAKNLYKNHNFTSPDDNGQQSVKSERFAEEIIKLFSHAKSILPDTIIALGCARPPGNFSEKLELELLKRGINAISFPADNTIRFAMENNFTYSFEELCCAFL
jgi:uncharacterized radical SAM superfamily protein